VRYGGSKGDDFKEKWMRKSKKRRILVVKKQKIMKIRAWIDQFNDWVGQISSWLSGLLVLLVLLDVLYRRLLSDTQTWIMELEWHIFALLFLFAAGYAFHHDKHVRVDLFYSKFNVRDKALVNLVGGLIFLLPWSAVMIITSFVYGQDALAIGERSPDPGGLPARYLIKFAITGGFVLLFLQGISSVLGAIETLRKRA
jgi:TRAP-type mannitol/chloroaromatic compound transport system permease small subunit